MRKFPTSIYSGRPQRHRRPTYKRKSLLDVVRGERKSSHLQEQVDKINLDMYVSGVSFTRIALTDVYRSFPE